MAQAVCSAGAAYYFLHTRHHDHVEWLSNRDLNLHLMAIGETTLTMVSYARVPGEQSTI